MQLRARFPELVGNNNTDPGRTLHLLATTPALWIHAPIYLGVQFLAKMKATAYDVAVDYRGNIVYGNTIVGKNGNEG